ASRSGEKSVLELDLVDGVDPGHRLRHAVALLGSDVERAVEALSGELAGHDAAPGGRLPVGEGEEQGERLEAAVGGDTDVELAVALPAALAGVGILGAVAGLLGDLPVAGRVVAVELAVALDSPRGWRDGGRGAGAERQAGREDVVLVDEALRVLLVVERERPGPDPDGGQEDGQREDGEAGEGRRRQRHGPAEAAGDSADHAAERTAVTAEGRRCPPSGGAPRRCPAGRTCGPRTRRGRPRPG